MSDTLVIDNKHSNQNLIKYINVNGMTFACCDNQAAHLDSTTGKILLSQIPIADLVTEIEISWNTF